MFISKFYNFQIFGLIHELKKKKNNFGLSFIKYLIELITQAIFCSIIL